ncbi:hypothetical protein VTJ49DRAFT_6039 [Mycothermus thermophilus]|uniref:Uncharacterized protein n=1 Tax=Humicola insolens TaxID=85995 RepID=A0ABR3V1Z2_HUMIN
MKSTLLLFLPTLANAITLPLPKNTTNNDPNKPIRNNPVRAGALLVGAGFEVVHAVVHIPNLRVAPGADPDQLHAVSAWIGVDEEETCPGTYLRVGVDMFLNSTGTWYLPWFGWHPNNTNHLPSLSILPGDWLGLHIQAANLTFADLTIKNRRTSQSCHAMAEDHPTLLCGFSALWMVEGHWTTKGLPLPDFGSIVFDEMQAVTSTAVDREIEDAYIEKLVEDGDGKPTVEPVRLGNDSLMLKYIGGHP